MKKSSVKVLSSRSSAAPKIFAALILFIALFTAFSSVSVIYGNSSYMYDDAGFFTETTCSKIDGELARISAEGGVKIYVATSELNLYGVSYDDLGLYFLESHGLDPDDSLILLIITRQYGTTYYDMYTYGDAEKRLKNSEINTILDDDNVYYNIKNGSIVDGVTAFANLSSQYYNDDDSVPIAPVILIGLLVGVLAAAVTCGIIIAKYKMKLVPSNYPLEHYTKLSLRNSQDVYITSSVICTTISSSSGGSGSFRGRGSSHSGRHRGGHRGGR